ncbi:hypothetical protein G9A89_012496 [Geosiphon pyriformis]|nr:hypothetical protein G9A89_012496 [Geosiphon pyriformis]
MNCHSYSHGITKGKRKKKKNLSGEQIRDLEVITAKVNQPQNRLGKRKEKRRNKKKSQHNLPPLHMSHILHNLRPPTVNLNLYALCAAKNCLQWVHVVATTKIGRQQHDIIVAHASLNMMADHQKHLEGYPHDKHEIWRMVYAMTEGATASELWEIKTNPLSLPEPEYAVTFDIFGNVEDDPEEFYEHYQQIASTKKEQEEQLAQLNTQLCDHCLILCDFQYCNKCDFIYNPLPYMIYTIPKEEEPISSCTSESESMFNSNSNSDNEDDKNISSSSTQYGNKNIYDSDFNSNPEIYIVLSDLSKEQELKWYSDNNKGIMPEHTHDTDTGFDLRYPRKDTIKLELYLCTYIDLKVALEIPATTMV